ncbi:MAG TPA: PQQ-dependent sugar dehydrogenase [Ardenticatenaceae bacterium]|nr:PQQ-dependent sugar dehydrogenase [Ardenticatenaceae bacterium]
MRLGIWLVFVTLLAGCARGQAPTATVSADVAAPTPATDTEVAPAGTEQPVSAATDTAEPAPADTPTLAASPTEAPSPTLPPATEAPPPTATTEPSATEAAMEEPGAPTATATESEPATPEGEASPEVELSPSATAAAPALSEDLTELPAAVYAEGLDQPVALAWAPDGRLFVAELVTGRVRVAGPDGQVQTQPVAEFRVAHPPGYSEHGLLGLALHPAFDENHLVYVFYSVPGDGGQPVKQVIARFREEGGLAAEEPQIVVDDLPVGPNCCHNGGRIAFGPDGKLYVTVGDTQDSSLAQRSDELAGNVLRYNDDGSVPDDGPFGAGNPVWAIGLRNPFGLAFDRESDELFLTENGPGENDEVNVIAAGSNYGWPEVTGVAGGGSFVDPIWVIGNTVAPTGIAIYRGNVLPGASGDLFFCNWNDGLLRQLEHDGSNERAIFDECLTDVVEGPDGALYVAGQGSIWRIGP